MNGYVNDVPESSLSTVLNMLVYYIRQHHATNYTNNNNNNNNTNTNTNIPPSLSTKFKNIPMKLFATLYKNYLDAKTTYLNNIHSGKEEEDGSSIIPEPML